MPPNFSKHKMLSNNDLGGPAPAVWARSAPPPREAMRQMLPGTERSFLPSQRKGQREGPRPAAKRDGGSAHDGAPANYLLSVTTSCNISSAVVITRALDWKPLCAVIMLVNS